MNTDERISHYLRRRLAAALVAVAATLLFLACGIESTPFIAGPKPDEIDLVPETGTDRIKFLHNENDNDTDEFRGYDLYYKLYEDEDGLCEAGDACRGDRDSILSNPVQTGPSRLLTRAYRRLVPENSPGQIPNVPVSNSIKANEFTVDIDLTGGGASNAFTATWPDATVTLNRRVAQGGTYKRFLDGGSYEDEDDDVDHSAITADISDVINDDKLYLAVYALGYGVDPGSLQALYSEPVYLGFVPVDIP
ncbi:MAG: hypothetical protein GVY23_08255 [Spirochaetes bacterium]|jgi:hypothetical protein|nr:hypothetical protein [Spirochaetota bacterium]